MKYDLKVHYKGQSLVIPGLEMDDEILSDESFDLGRMANDEAAANDFLANVEVEVVRRSD